MSIAGLMALGAWVSALGASSGVRHLYLPSKRGKSTETSGYIFIPAVANWMKRTFALQAIADPDLDEIFGCECIVCGPGGDLRLLLVEGIDPELVDRHSVAAAVKLAHKVIDDKRSPIDAWTTVCDTANANYGELKRLGVSGPTAPPVLSAWLELLG